MYYMGVQIPQREGATFGGCPSHSKALAIFADTYCLVTSPTGAVAKYYDEYVCLSVCLSVRISPEPHVRSLPIFVRVAYARGLVLRHVGDGPRPLGIF